MDRRYLRSSSLARKFFDDFPEAVDMPLEFMYAMQHRAYDQHVLPLLELFNSHPSLNYCCGAVKHLVDAIARDNGIYEQSRAAAEYIQSPFAVCALDAAAACSVHPLAAQFYRQLSACDTTALDELLYEDLRRRLVANGLQDLTESLAVQLDDHPAVSAATPHPTDLDRLVLPRDAAYNSNCSNVIGLDSAAPGSESRSVPSAGGASSSQQAAAPASAYGISADATATAVAAPSILKRAAWRRQLSRFSSHYLAPILGKDGQGSVLLTGRVIADVVEGVNIPPPPEPAAAEATRDISSNASGSVLDISFVGYGDAAAAQSALDGCLEELITRWFMRHPSPPTDPQGQILLPLAVAAQQHLLLLLPEPTQPLLPAAVHIDAAAMQAAVDHGAFDGPAAAAAAATGQQITHPEGTGFRDVIFRFDLALHPSIEVLLLSAAAAGDLVTAPAGSGSGSKSSVSQMHRAPVLLLAAANARNEFAYDGDNVYTLPSAVRALASGGTLVDLAAVAAGCGSQDASGNACSTAAAAATGRCSVNAAALMDDPAALRAILDPGRRQQQQQQQVEAMQVEEQDVVAAAGSNNGGMTDTEKHRTIQQLRRDHEWVWGLVDRPAGAASSDSGQGTFVGCLPDIVHNAVASSWWKGPVMRGSVLYGADV